jgi:hypothetical protein
MPASYVGHKTTTANLADQCALLHQKVTAFLNRLPVDDRIARAQRMTRESLAIIAEALHRYEYLYLHSRSLSPLR